MNYLIADVFMFELGVWYVKNWEYLFRLFDSHAVKRQ
jgi:hypothetical protein